MNTHPILWSGLGLGTGTLASLGRSTPLAQVRVILDAMRESGVRVIDTADCYGSGACERLIGKALHGNRDDFTVVTKAGYCYGDLPGPLRPLNPFLKKAIHRMGRRQIFDPTYLARCLDRSLSRLKMNRVDAFLLHDPSLEAVTDERVIRVCEGLKKSGKTVLTGVSSGDPAVLKAAIASGAFEVIETPASLKVAGTLQAIWRECEAHRIHVIANHVFDPACLEHPGMTHETLMRCSSALLPPHSTILCGTRNPAHLRQSNEWAKAPLSVTDAEQWAKIVCIGE